MAEPLSPHNRSTARHMNAYQERLPTLVADRETQGAGRARRKKRNPKALFAILTECCLRLMGNAGAAAETLGKASGVKLSLGPKWLRKSSQSAHTSLFVGSSLGAGADLGCRQGLWAVLSQIGWRSRNELPFKSGGKKNGPDPASDDRDLGWMFL